MLDNLKNKITKDELLSGSIVLFIMINIFNVLNYFFHFFMARMLGPEEYGVLAVLFSFVYIFSIPSEAIQNITTVYTSKFISRGETGKVKIFLLKGLKKGFLASTLIFLIFLPIAYFFSGYLNIDFRLLVYTGLILFSCFSLPIVRGILQGQKKFVNFGISLVTEGAVKLILAVILVAVGWKVFGGLTGVLLGIFFTFFISLGIIKEVFKTKEEEANFKGIYLYSIPYFVSLLAIVLIYSLDVIFAKRFFSPEIAGNYAVASILGKAIFFGTSAIGKAMFPLTSEKHERGEKTGHLVRKSIKILILVTSLLLLTFLTFPKETVSLLFGNQYSQASSILFILGIAFTMLAVTNLVTTYGLSVNRIKKSAYSLLIFVIIELGLFYFFHSSLRQFSIAFLIVNFLMMVYSICILRINKK